MGKTFMKGGTPTGSSSVCQTCSHAQIMVGYRESERVTMCNYPTPSFVVPFTMYECSNHYDKNRPSWKQMEDLAIDIVPGPLKPVGFKLGLGFEQTANKIAVEDDD